MHRCLNYLLGVLIVAAMSGCNGSVPTSPSSNPSPAAALLPESIELISVSADAGSTLRPTGCRLDYEFVNCFGDLRLTFAVRSNRDVPFARLFAELRRSDGRVCGETLMETETFMKTFQPVVAGVVTKFQVTPVYLKPDCWDLLPFQTTTVLARVMALSPGTLVELMKQEFEFDLKFTR